MLSSHIGDLCLLLRLHSIEFVCKILVLIFNLLLRFFLLLLNHDPHIPDTPILGLTAGFELILHLMELQVIVEDCVFLVRWIPSQFKGMSKEGQVDVDHVEVLHGFNADLDHLVVLRLDLIVSHLFPPQWRNGLELGFKDALHSEFNFLLHAFEVRGDLQI